MPPRFPRFDWHSSMTAPMNSLGTRIVALVIGSLISRTLPLGKSDGLSTSISVPSSMTTW